MRGDISKEIQHTQKQRTPVDKNNGTVQHCTKQPTKMGGYVGVQPGVDTEVEERSRKKGALYARVSPRKNGGKKFV